VVRRVQAEGGNPRVPASPHPAPAKAPWRPRYPRGSGSSSLNPKRPVFLFPPQVGDAFTLISRLCYCFRNQRAADGDRAVTLALPSPAKPIWSE